MLGDHGNFVGAMQRRAYAFFGEVVIIAIVLAGSRLQIALLIPLIAALLGLPTSTGIGRIMLAEGRHRGSSRRRGGTVT